MNNFENNQPNKIPTSNTSLAVFERIEKEAILPYSRWRFLLEEWGVWILWGATVILGALALSITSYITISATYELYEATHTNFFTFFVTVLPYIWVILFIVMTYLAVVELKNTKHGYRYNTLQILGSSMIFSVIIASGFHFLGFGYIFDQILGRQIGIYMSMEKMELKLWQSPDNGRLVGISVPMVDDIESGRDDDVTIVGFKDKNGTLWQLNTSELSLEDFALLQSDKIVRMLGVRQGALTFQACAVFPWMFEKPLAWSQMQGERRSFEERMHNHNKMPSLPQNIVIDRSKISNPVNSSTINDNNFTDGICTHLKMMGNVR